MDNKIAIKWKRKAFTHIDPEEKQKLFEHVPPDYKQRLFENLNDRLKIDEDGSLVMKRDYGDGLYPVISTSKPDAVTLPMNPLTTEGVKGSNVSEVVTKSISFASGNFSLKLLSIQEFVEEKSEGEERNYRYVFLVQTAWGEFVEEVDAMKLENFEWVKNATNGRAFFAERKDYVQFARYVHEVIESDISTARKEKIYKCGGWKKINEKWGYVCDIGVIGAKRTDVRAVQDLKFEIESEMKKSDSINYFRGMENICKKTENASFLTAFTNMSVMTSLFAECGSPIKMLAGIIGTTNSLKTSVALAFTNIFNAGKTTRPELTFTSTRAGIESYVTKYGDAVLLVDDFMPGNGKAEQAELNAKLELLCRLYGDRTSKKRMTVFSGKDVEFPVRGCCMITGEHMTGVQSSRTRIVYVNFERGDVDKDVLAFYQANPLLLPTYLQGFIEYLSRDVERIMRRIREGVIRYRKGLNFAVARFNEAAAQFLVTIDVVTEYWLDEIPDLDIDKIRAEWKENILKIFRENDCQIIKLDAGRMIMEAFEEAMQMKPEKVKRTDEICKTDSGAIYYDENFHYVQLKELYVAVKEFCKKYDILHVPSQDEIVAKLVEMDVIERKKNNDGHLESSRKLLQGKGNNRRYLYIRTNVMQKILERGKE